MIRSLAAYRFPPDKHVPHRDPSEMPNPILREYVEQLEPIKDKFLRGRPHWYCHFLGRQPERRDPGMPHLQNTL